MTDGALTDRHALDRHRIRAGAAPTLFLQETVARELHERRELVNRTFTAPAVVTPWPAMWREAVPDARIVRDAETLDLEQGAHDLVIHALCMHWANDPVGQLIQCRRALAPDGLFLAAQFGGRTLWELRAVLAETEAAVKGGLSPRVLPMAEIRDLGGLMQRAGFTLPVADSQTQTVTYPDAIALMRDLRAMGESNAMRQRPKGFTQRRIVLESAARYSDAFGLPDRRIPATFEILFLTGWAPGPGQPQPLRPGTAAQRLSDALGTEETPLRDPATPRRD